MAGRRILEILQTRQQVVGSADVVSNQSYGMSVAFANH
jgi:hypothetical protein